MLKHVPALALSAALATVAATSAAARYGSAEGDVIGGRDIQVTVKPGKAYMLPIPATKYAGAPIEYAISDPTFAATPNNSGSWVMHQVVSDVNGEIGWVTQFSNGEYSVGHTQPGQTLLSVVPVGSEEGLQLSVSASDTSPQTFVISIRSGA